MIIILEQSVQAYNTITDGIATPDIGVTVVGSFACIVAVPAISRAISQYRCLQLIITIVMLYCIIHGRSKHGASIDCIVVILRLSSLGDGVS